MPVAECFVLVIYVEVGLPKYTALFTYFCSRQERMEGNCFEALIVIMHHLTN